MIMLVVQWHGGPSPPGRRTTLEAIAYNIQSILWIASCWLAQQAHDRLDPRSLAQRQAALHRDRRDDRRADVKSGRLAPGDRLPPQRKLATRLSIDFTTVARGYVEAQRRGLIESRVGQGTFVRGARRPGSVDGDIRANIVDLSMNLPPEPTDPDLVERMREGCAEVARDLVFLLRYQGFGGTRADKDAASAWLGRRALVPKQERLFVVPGAHPARFSASCRCSPSPARLSCARRSPTRASARSPRSSESSCTACRWTSTGSSPDAMAACLRDARA